MGSTIGLAVGYSVEQEEPTRAIHEEVSTPITNESVEEASTSKFTKKNKKDKKANLGARRRADRHQFEIRMKMRAFHSKSRSLLSNQLGRCQQI